MKLLQVWERSLKFVLSEHSTLILDGQTVVLGLSGGPDSVCLLYELRALDAARRAAGGAGNPIVCAHIHHGLRGADADADEAFVFDLCERFAAPFASLRIDAAALAKETGETVEEAGRAARYDFFDRVCEKYAAEPPPCIAVAHNQDDQIETVFMRIARGTGLDGLSGMAIRRKSAAGFDVVRPLLGVSRSEIDKRLAAFGAESRPDASNFKTAYFRNKIRIEILPYLESETGVPFRASLLRLAENAAEDRDYFEKAARETLSALRGASDACSEQLALPAAALAALHAAIRHRVIKLAFAELGLRRDIAAVHLAATDRLLETFQSGGEASGKYVEFPLDYTFGVAGKQAVFRAPSARAARAKPRRAQDGKQAKKTDE